MILPDYKNSIKNISASFSKYLGKEDGSTIEILDNELNKNYKNIIFIVFDGMGVDVLNKIGKNTIMANNMVHKVTSVFPSTTTNATTTLLTNKLVNYHKYLAWCMYFKSKNRCIDIYMHKDTYTQEPVDNYLNTDITPYFFNFSANRKICSVFPSFIKKSSTSKNNAYANTVEELAESVINMCASNEEKFIYCYCTEPDSTMHVNGVSSTEAYALMKRIDKTVKEIYAKTQDSLIVITADHGHIDVKGNIELYKDKSVMDCLARPLSMEPRATSYKLKPNKEKDFLDNMKKYEKDIKLVKAQELIEKGVFGDSVDDELKDYLGDYIGIGTDTFKLVRFCEDKMYFKGHHTSLTEEEMYVPLIMINNRK